ncbi:AMP-dependent synthetase [Mycobacterium antarcticum]|uniref:AMP-binding protein n=1 Tax=unclassified Mycolicibacterium TaxID=2636767 RepID=UPI0023873DB1|nr:MULTISPECIES: AMP-binding protein [unclassified Mycolicibacterium]BDX33136.1 AMP-dependent synthetase [Mycolicibacterium sp. TUM20985]GLP76310.1 AMP-dependent synthetase [Mycolicibacterium sp. TUM20983]GLP83310.1 AMP-dependent synthetase [Mycolicibacterium sp. TUM20984]
MFDRLLDHLVSFGDHPALLTAHQRLSYRELADRVTAAASELGSQRRLVLLETRNDVDTVVNYLGALAGGHVVIPLPADADHTAVIEAYDPEVIVRGDRVEHRHRAAHDLHPDLALLLSTSGSTGSPKLVRLSTANLTTNAEAIATYLNIRENDRAATTLPMSYCYGLSVLHSHLLRGAGMVLTDHSVVDDELWDLMTQHHVTSFAGVPHTFDLLDRVGFDDMVLPHLRYVTAAGGRLAPDRVRRFAELGRRRGWQLFVMYGATEATARMAYLPPELATENPHSIGVPIPGGAFEVLPLDGEPVDGMPDGVGELVYRGPGVMMGYAHGPGDLAAGHVVEALHTGDLARRNAHGLYEVVGRIDRFAKLFGLRLDLERVEASLRTAGVTAICAEGDGLLVVAAADRPPGCDVVRHAAEASGLPRAAVRVLDVDEIPRLPSGKPDFQSVRELADRPPAVDPGRFDLRALFADVLHLDVDSIDRSASFVDLGGNSLSYVSMSVRLERAIGHLPADWQQLPVGELEAAAKPRRWWGTTLETSVALRAIAIVMVVGSHAGLYTLWGGAHVLLGVAGYNFGRFCLTPLPRSQRVRHLRNTIAWIAVPSAVWVAIALVITDDYTPWNLLLADKFLGPGDSLTSGRLWFVEIVVWILVVLALVCWMPLADRLERRKPYAFAMAFLAAGLVVRFDGFGMGHAAWFTVLAFWFFAIGWAASKASTVRQRAVVTGFLAIGVIGYFGEVHRELLVFAGLGLLIWLPGLRCPSALTAVAGVLAEASLVIYLVHYQVYPLFGDHRLAGVTASVLAGVALTQLLIMARRRIRIGGARPVSSRPAAPAPR